MGLPIAPLRRALFAAALLPIFAAPALADPPACADIAQHYDETNKGLSSIQLNNVLFNAAENGCEALGARLLADGASVAARDRDANTPLSRAARGGHIGFVDLLVKHGADLNERNVHGSTALYLAVENNRTEAVEQLLALGAKPDIPGRSALTPLAAAAFNGNGKIVDLLIEKGADVDAPDTTGKSPILYAAARGFKEVVERLLAAKIDINKKYGHDLTVLMWAAGHSNDVPEDDGVALVKELLDRGAKPSDIDDRGRNALMIASELGHAAVVELLLARGVPADIKDAGGKTALDLAADDETRGKFAKK
jgi:ankyrin repeat protein